MVPSTYVHAVLAMNNVSMIKQLYAMQQPKFVQSCESA